MKSNESLIYASLFLRNSCRVLMGMTPLENLSNRPAAYKTLTSRIGMSARPMPSSLAVKQELWIIFLFILNCSSMDLCSSQPFSSSLLLSIYICCFLELWQRRTAPYGTHRQGKYGAQLVSSTQATQIANSILKPMVYSNYFTCLQTEICKLTFWNRRVVRSQHCPIFDLLSSLSRLYRMCPGPKNCDKHGNGNEAAAEQAKHQNIQTTNT